MWTLPEPVATDNSTRPLMVSVRSKVASEARAGMASASIAVARTRCFMVCLTSVSSCPGYARGPVCRIYTRFFISGCTSSAIVGIKRTSMNPTDGDRAIHIHQFNLSEFEQRCAAPDSCGSRAATRVQDCRGAIFAGAKARHYLCQSARLKSYPDACRCSVWFLVKLVPRYKTWVVVIA
jgi:hypothetical protein